jgi:hypothetical protein
MKITLRFVPHQDVDRYLGEGWVITHDLADCYHGEFAVLMMKGPANSDNGIARSSAPVDCR